MDRLTQRWCSRRGLAAGGLISVLLVVVGVWAWQSAGPLPVDQGSAEAGGQVGQSLRPLRAATAALHQTANFGPSALPVAGCQRSIPAYPLAAAVAHLSVPSGDGSIRRCGCNDFCAAASACGHGPYLEGVDCGLCEGQHEPRWHDRRMIPWQMFGQGEYVGPHRPQHVPVYRLRVDDQLELVYRLTRRTRGTAYELEEGDEVLIESLSDENLDRNVTVQPDGMITLRLLGQVRAAGRSVEQLRETLEKTYEKYYRVPGITVTPTKMNTRLEDLRDSVDSRFGRGGQSVPVRVTPSGTIQLPGIGSVPAQGLTLDELKREVDERYEALVQGIEVTPLLTERAPRYVYVLGEVQNSGRFTLEAPTTVMQSIALAGGWNNGGNLREIVIFRRAEDWRLIATKIDIQGALYSRRPCPADEIWLRDSDVVVVPKSFLLLSDDFIDLVFTRGIYGVMPFQGISINFFKDAGI